MKAKTLSLALAAALMLGGAATVHATDLAPLEARAAAGDSSAMVDLGEALLARDRPVEGLMYLENVVILGRPEEDVARAHAALGRHYGRITTNAIARATSLQHYQRAAVLGHVPSQVQLGRLYMDDAKRVHGKERDSLLDNALVVLQHAASQAGDIEAAFLLGYSFLTGDGFRKNADVGMAWLKLAGERGHAQAAFEAGSRELKARNAAEASRFLGMAGRAGSTHAMMLLAQSHLDGTLLAKDTVLARMWAKQADARGVRGAKELLARIDPPTPTPAATPAIPETGFQPASQLAEASPPTAVDDAETRRMRELEERNAELERMVASLAERMKAMEAGDSKAIPTAAAPLARSAPTPTLPKDPAVATSRVAAITTPAMDDAPAAVSTQAIAPAEVAQAGPDEPWSRRAPRLTDNERGLQEHSAGQFDKAARHFARAARAGDPDAMNNLGMLKLQGQGVAADREAAMELFRRAAEAGHSVAARNIGYMYQQGLGVGQDLARASIWLRHAGSLERRQVLGRGYAGL